MESLEGEDLVDRAVDSSSKDSMVDFRDIISPKWDIYFHSSHGSSITSSDSSITSCGNSRYNSQGFRNNRQYNFWRARCTLCMRCDRMILDLVCLHI